MVKLNFLMRNGGLEEVIKMKKVKMVKGIKVGSPTKKSTTATTKKSLVWTWEELMEMGHS